MPFGLGVEAVDAVPVRDRGVRAVRAVPAVLVLLATACAAQPLFREPPPPAAALLLLAGLAVLAVLLTVLVSGAGRPAARLDTTVLLATWAVAAAVLVEGGPELAAVPALAAGTAAFRTTSLRAALVVGATLAGVVVLLALRDPGALVALTVRAAVLAGAVGATGVAVALARQVERSRGGLLRLAALEHRDRATRDVHEVLGQSLAAIALHSEVATRLVPRDPDAAVREMSGVIDIARRSVTDVRSLADGYRERTLVQEIHGAVELLVAADIDASAGAVPPGLPPGVREAFGLVVREAATNVLRHSAAATCRIELEVRDGTACLTIVNDGAGGPVPAFRARAGGHALGGLAERLGAVGGLLEHGPAGHGEYRVRVTAPVR